MSCELRYFSDFCLFIMILVLPIIVGTRLPFTFQNFVYEVV